MASEWGGDDALLYRVDQDRRAEEAAHMGPGWMYPDIPAAPPDITLMDVMDAEFGDDIERERVRCERRAEIERSQSRLNYKRMCRASEYYEAQRVNLEMDGQQEQERLDRIARYEAELLAEQQETQDI